MQDDDEEGDLYADDDPEGTDDCDTVDAADDDAEAGATTCQVVTCATVGHAADSVPD